MTNMQQEEVHLTDYLNVVLKRKWIILTCLLVVVMVTAYATFTKDPVYKGTAKLLIEKKSPNILNTKDLISSGANSNKYYQTQYEIIKSRSLANKVCKKLDLFQHEEFHPEPKKDPVSVAKRAVSSAIGSVVSGVKNFVFPRIRTDKGKEIKGVSLENSISEAKANVIDQFQGRLSVSPVRETHMVKVSFEASSPKLAAKIANAVGQAYIDYNLETKMETVKQAVSWLKKRLKKERQKVQQAQNKFLEYRKKHNITTDISPQTEQIRVKRLSDLKSQILQAKTKRQKLESKYKQAKQYFSRFESLNVLPDILTNKVIQSIKESELELSIKMSKLSEKYGSNHPKIKSIRSQLRNLRERKKNEAEKIVQSLKQEYQTALSEERSLKQSLQDEKQEAMELNQMAIQYGVLKRKAESAKEMYDMLVKRFKEASLTEDIQTVNTRVVDRSEVPGNPVRPQKKRNMLLAVILGLALGTGVSFFAEYMDNTFKSPEDISKILGIPYLGMIPLMKQDKGTEPALISYTSPHSIYSEAYRGIRTNLLFSAADVSPQILHVTSSGPYEGKTVTAANLATTLAQAGETTLIIDCDMRKPMLHKHFQLERDMGLSNALTGSKDLSEIQFRTYVEGLHCIASGPIPPNPSELLGSKRMQQILDSLSEQYDRIIIDSPPITAVTDASILASRAQGVILVVQAFESTQKMVQSGLDQIRNVGAKVLGGVLNGVDMEKEGAYHSYYSYYYYYTEEGKKRKSSGKEMS